MGRCFLKHRYIFCVFVLHFAVFTSDFTICGTAAVKSAIQYDSNVYIVTPVSVLSKEKENEFYPVFLPTPLPENKPSTSQANEQSVKTSIHTTVRPSLSTQPDLIIAEFRAGSGKIKGKPNERMLSVKEMLEKEKINSKYTSTKELTTTDKPKTTTVSNMNVQDVWDIINHNDNLEQRNSKKNESFKVVNANSRHSFSNLNTSYTIETVPSIEVQEDGWPDAVPKMGELLKHSKNDNDDINIDDASPSAMKSTGRWSNPQHYASQRQPQKLHYYPSYSPNEDFTNIDDTQYESQPEMGEAIDRYNPAKPYLPPKQNIPTVFKPNPPPPPAPMPPPPPPMPPPQPPRQVISPPSMDSYSYDPPSPPPDSSQDKPPNDFYMSYGPSDMSNGPPSYPPPDQHDHSHHHDGDFKFQLPPSDGPPSSGVGSAGIDTYPPLIFDHDPHDHHHDHVPEFDYHDFHHHHEHHHPPPTTTTTTEAPPVEDKRVNNRYSYYYLGKKLWYLPLYFSIYFICYVGVLIVKSIARHKITYPQHWKTKRSLGGSWGMSDETIQMLTKFATDALIKSAAKYVENRS